MLEFHFAYSPWLIVVSVIVAAGLSWWMYRELSVDISLFIRRLLTVLRFLTLFILSVLLLEPLISTVTSEEIPPIVALVQDNSESLLAQKDSTYFKKEHSGKLAELKKKLESQGIVVHTFEFGNDLISLKNLDSLQYKKSATDIGNALTSISDRYTDQNLAAVILVSDGISTAGRNPIYATENYKQPIFSVLAGDTTTQKDVRIETVLYNEISYVQTETPITTTISSYGYENKNVEVSLTNKGKILQTKNLTLPNQTSRQQVTFNILLNEVGIQQFEVHITPLENEQNYQNNHKLFFINVLENKVKIGVFAGGPHPDIGALYKCFGKNQRFTFKEFIRKSESEFYSQPTPEAISDCDVFILHNFPSTVNDRQVLDLLYLEADKRKLPVFNIIGTMTNMKISPRQPEFLALTTEKYVNRFTEALQYLNPTYENHATFSFDKTFFRFIETAPPLLRNDSEWQLSAGAEVIGKAKIKGIRLEYPVLALQDNNGRKTISLIGENIWRYRMHCYLENTDFELFDQWMQNLIQWLITREDKRKFKVYPIKNLFTGDERVVFKGQVYDDTYKPLSQAEVKMTLTDPQNKEFDYYLTEIQAGNYTLELDHLSEGNYKFKAIGTAKGRIIGTDRGQFSIGRSDLEFTNLKADWAVMSQIAQRTNGHLFPIKNISQVADSVLISPTVKPLLEYHKSSLSFNRFLLPLLLVLFLLTAEWVLRKRNGLL